MPRMVIRYEIPQGTAENLASLFIKHGGRGGLTRTAQHLGIHRDTILRGLKRGMFGQQVGCKIIEGLKSAHPDIEKMLVLKFD